MIIALVGSRSGRDLLRVDQFESGVRIVLIEGDGENLIGLEQTQRALAVIARALTDYLLGRFSGRLANDAGRCFESRRADVLQCHKRDSRDADEQRRVNINLLCDSVCDVADLSCKVEARRAC